MVNLVVGSGSPSGAETGSSGFSFPSRCHNQANQEETTPRLIEDLAWQSPLAAAEILWAAMFDNADRLRSGLMALSTAIVRLKMDNRSHAILATCKTFLSSHVKLTWEHVKGVHKHQKSVNV